MLVCPGCGRENPDDAKFCNGCGAALVPAAPAREVRKTVTVLFSDVTGSTSLGERLDPEAVRRVMARWFEAARGVLERHGGTVEKFVGDAVMAVFGIPVLHEDDALRAVRAAADLRDELDRLNAGLERDHGVQIEVRTGVNTGEVVAGEGQTLATGDAVNVAARLEQAAAPGEILLGARTLSLVRAAVEAEPVEPLALKGKAEPVPAFRLKSVRRDAPGFARRLDAPMVGRDGELAQLAQAYRRAIEERAPYLFTVLGTAGIGKSRLTYEFLAGVRAEATILRGRCLPYGDGITYWPLSEMLQEAAHHELRARLLELLAGEPDAELIAGRLAGTLGAAGPGATSEETAWAARKLFERLARERPLVIVFDDLHWGEPTLLDLVDHLIDWSRGAPILVLCLARPELLEVRPGWGGGKLNATSILLEPLSEEQAVELIEGLLGENPLDAVVRARIADAAEGNPLFVEQMLAMLREDGADVELAVPPTIQALLAARLDRLGREERAVIGRASVEGKVFHRSAVAELAPDELRGAVGATSSRSSGRS
jgi:class 3 adenylate cyclase